MHLLGDPLPIFLKVNFDGSVVNERGDTRFVIYSPDSRLITARGAQLFETTMPGVELSAA